MSEYETRGRDVRHEAKELVLDFMRATVACRPGGDGMSQTSLFRSCGLDWGDQPTSTSTNQQYWVVALLRELDAEGKIERMGKLWRLT